MNIIVVNVNTSRSMTEAIAEAARRSRRSTHAPPDPREIIAWPLPVELEPRGGSVGASSAHPASPAGGQGGE